MTCLDLSYNNYYNKLIYILVNYLYNLVNI